MACWSLATGSDFASLWFGEAAWQWSAGLLTVGCGMAVVAMTTGLIELARVPEGAALRDAYLHMTAMLVAFALFTARLLLRQEALQPLPPDGLALVLDAAGFIALAAGGWLGGRLAYGHGVGRDLQPKPDSAPHP
ncbi:hypothetical protein N788_01725 [Arenimonas donghaensis DSM 18148 = HO3-R19]|uniref:DUF2231 domain-containing protein n=1 Tax=Arenimonas donghaensis DSM 18148 = HO3-R19 TaxID=1121014 RepID=A0A087MM13_9GAMM|nr:hypothetical protein N788_01725 [Arenimonas donghaensis DSM 18148 = HO3-R19]